MKDCPPLVVNFEVKTHLTIIGPVISNENLSAKLSGVLLPATTPFTRDEAIDVAGLTSNLEKWNGTAVTGYVVLGSTGERLNLDEHEYLEVIEITRRAIPETSAFIVGAGQQSTRGTVAEIKRA